LGSAEIIILLIVALVVILPFWKIFSKAVFSGSLPLLMLIPLVNLLMIFFLVFTEWPALKQVKHPDVT